MKELRFSVAGKDLDFDPARESERRMRKYLDRLPFGKLLTAEELGRAFGLAPMTVKERSARPEAGMADHRQKVGKGILGLGSNGCALVFGSRRTIAALRKRLGLEDA